RERGGVNGRLRSNGKAAKGVEWSNSVQEKEILKRRAYSGSSHTSEISEPAR
ncbi:hypothetical protein HispidOSU_028476, partial [Sigmodon hispidus]